jgi:hypothetical protein
MLQGNLFDVFNPDVVAVKIKKAFVPDAPASPKKKIDFSHASKITVVPNLSIYPSKIVQYNTYEGLYKTPLNTENLKQNNPDGTLSHKASVRIKVAISWLTHLAKWCDVQDLKLKKKFRFKINFITLTLPSPQVKCIVLPCGFEVPFKNYKDVWPAVNIGFGKVKFHMTDKQIKSDFLDQFLTEIRKKYHVKHYVWRAEAQANGNIHFHITLNKFIYCQELRTLWNRILDKSDFIQRYHDKFSKLDFENYCLIADPGHNKAYKKLQKSYEYGILTNWNNPNTTDVHSVKNIRNIEAYLSEYFSKKDTSRRLIEGYLWRLSESLSKLKHAHVLIDTGLSAELNYFQTVFKDNFRFYKYASILYQNMQCLFETIRESRIVKAFEAYKNKILGLNPIPI